MSHIPLLHDEVSHFFAPTHTPSLNAPTQSFDEIASPANVTE